MTTSTAPAVAAICPQWCAAVHDDRPVRDCVSTPTQIASFVSDAPLTVAVVQTTYFLPEPVLTATAVRVAGHELSPAVARRLAAELLAAADLADLEA